MKLLDQAIYDFGFTMPRVIITGKVAVIENVSSIVMISEGELTVSSGVSGEGGRYTTVKGENFVINQIGEGRLVIEGTIRRVEFL
ncbi:MAG: YabP/YqfC family sporulation protein [Firmicutes bacterium]|nr:YabP/YqfC family sporulation protein [Bacillota bacterium]